MKVVHLNKKNLELEAAYKEMAVEIGAKRAKLTMKRYLKLKAKYEANKKPGAETPADVKPSNYSIY